MTYVRQDAVQEEAENLIAWMLATTAARDAELRARLRRITSLSERQRMAMRKNGNQEAARQSDFEDKG